MGTEQADHGRSVHGTAQDHPHRRVLGVFCDAATAELFQGGDERARLVATVRGGAGHVNPQGPPNAPPGVRFQEALGPATGMHAVRSRHAVQVAVRRLGWHADQAARQRRGEAGEPQPQPAKLVALLVARPDVRYRDEREANHARPFGDRNGVPVAERRVVNALPVPVCVVVACPFFAVYRDRGSMHAAPALRRQHRVAPRQPKAPCGHLVRQLRGRAPVCNIEARVGIPWVARVQHARAGARPVVRRKQQRPVCVAEPRDRRRLHQRPGPPVAPLGRRSDRGEQHQPAGVRDDAHPQTAAQPPRFRFARPGGAPQHLRAVIDAHDTQHQGAFGRPVGM